MLTLQDVSFCFNLTTKKAIEIILETCPSISNLNVDRAGTDEAVESDLVSAICSKYQSTLKHLSVHGLTNDSLFSIAERCGSSLRSICVPTSDVNDEVAAQFTILIVEGNYSFCRAVPTTFVHRIGVKRRKPWNSEKIAFYETLGRESSALARRFQCGNQSSRVGVHICRTTSSKLPGTND
jgi:hypothetical protein